MCGRRRHGRQMSISPIGHGVRLPGTHDERHRQMWTPVSGHGHRNRAILRRWRWPSPLAVVLAGRGRDRCGTGAAGARCRQPGTGRRLLFHVHGALETGASPLTARECDVLRAAEEGSATHEIATRLALSRHRAQLPVQRHHQDRRAQPDRRDPHRPRRRLDLTGAVISCAGTRGSSRRRARPRGRTRARPRSARGRSGRTACRSG